MNARVCLVLMLSTAGRADDFASLCRDRAAIERVYYEHRLGDKLAFEKTMPEDLLERLVRQDLNKETTLKKVYGVEVSPMMIETEVNRINSTTRAPEMLAELKAALGNGTNRFARVVARPIVVERLLRERFDNDDRLHAPARQSIERAREGLLKEKQGGGSVEILADLLKRDYPNQIVETSWEMGVKPAEKTPTGGGELAEVQRQFGPKAQILSSSAEKNRDSKLYFDDLPIELRNVLRVQLRQPGDVSAVIEMPSAFVLFLARERTPGTLSVTELAISKRNYEQWLKDESGR